MQYGIAMCPKRVNLSMLVPTFGKSNCHYDENNFKNSICPRIGKDLRGHARYRETELNISRS